MLTHESERDGRRSGPAIAELADSLAAAMHSLEPDEAQLALYRQLAAGEPVRDGELARAVRRAESEVADALADLPGVFCDGDGRIVSFCGLAIPQTPHSFCVDWRQLHTWCAWDAFFIPELIGRKAEVESQPPGGGGPIRLVVDPDGIRDVVPEGAVISLRRPTEAFDETVITSFCHFVHFFGSPDAGAEWVAEHPGTFVVSVGEAHELGRIVNRKRFGAALAVGGEAIGELR